MDVKELPTSGTLSPVNQQNSQPSAQESKRQPENTGRTTTEAEGNPPSGEAVKVKLSTSVQSSEVAMTSTDIEKIEGIAIEASKLAEAGNGIAEQLRSVPVESSRAQALKKEQSSDPGRLRL